MQLKKMSELENVIMYFLPNKWPHLRQQIRWLPLRDQGSKQIVQVYASSTDFESSDVVVVLVVVVVVFVFLRGGSVSFLGAIFGMFSFSTNYRKMQV